MTSLPISIVLLVAASLAGHATSQAGKIPTTPSSKTTPQSKTTPKKPPEAKWPPLKQVRKSLAKETLPRAASANEERAAKARKLILGYGPGVAPVLLEALRSRTKAKVRDVAVALLDKLIQPKHGPLLARAYTGKNAIRDRYVIGKLAQFRSKTYLSVMRKAAHHKDPAVVELASFALANLGDTAALPFLFEQTKTNWKERNYDIRVAGLALKGDKATRWLLDRLFKEDTPTKMAALRLLGVAGVRKCASTVAAYLDSQQHQLRAGAVNALRGIIDGDPPHRTLSVFQAINAVKKWKARVGR